MRGWFLGGQLRPLNRTIRLKSQNPLISENVQRDLTHFQFYWNVALPRCQRKPKFWYERNGFFAGCHGVSVLRAVGVGKKKSEGLAVYRMVFPQSFCSLQRGFYLQPIILEFSFSQLILTDPAKPAWIFVRWKKGEKKKVRHLDGSLHEYPILAFYICVNRDLAYKGTFRQAHHAVGAVVALAENRKKKIHELTRAELAMVDDRLGRVDEKLGRGVSSVFDLKRAMARRNLIDVPSMQKEAKRKARPQKIF